MFLNNYTDDNIEIGFYLFFLDKLDKKPTITTANFLIENKYIHHKILFTKNNDFIGTGEKIYNTFYFSKKNSKFCNLGFTHYLVEEIDNSPIFGNSPLITNYKTNENNKNLKLLYPITKKELNDKQIKNLQKTIQILENLLK